MWSVDKIQDPTYRSKFINVPDAIAEWVHDHGGLGGRDVLDFGCGEATAALSMALRQGCRRVVGVEIHDEIENALTYGRAQLGLEELPKHLELIQLESTSMLDALGTFDIIYSWSVFAHVRKDLIQDCFSKLKRVLRPNGIMFLQTTPLYYSAYGSHFQPWISTPWAHLIMQQDLFYKELRKRTDTTDQADQLIHVYEELNRVTAAQLLRIAEQAGFEIIREYRTYDEFPIPEELREIYSMDVLRTQQLVFLAKHAGISSMGGNSGDYEAEAGEQETEVELSLASTETVTSTEATIQTSGISEECHDILRNDAVDKTSFPWLNQNSAFQKTLLTIAPIRSLRNLLHDLVAQQANSARIQDEHSASVQGLKARLDRQETRLLSFFSRFPAPQIINVPNPQLRPHALRILALLRPQDVTDWPLIRKGRDFDGGYVMVDHGLQNAIVYSLGISDDVSWDLEMAENGCEVFQYDHTIDRLPIDHPRFHWSKVGICEQANSDSTFQTIDQLINSNQHRGEKNLVLKMDIEGAEWRVLEMIPQNTLNMFSQIVMELHWLTNINDPNNLRRFVSGLKKLNEKHQLVHLHANNYGNIAFIGGVLLPDTLEVTYVRKDDYKFTKCEKTFPTDLDMPCNPNAVEFFLGAVGLIS